MKMQSKRRWLQFRLRSWLVLVALISVALIGFARYREWQRQERARIQFEMTLDYFDSPQLPVIR